MYSSNQDFHMETSDYMFINNQPRTRTSLPQQSPSSYMHHGTSNFGPMAINPSNTVGGNSGGAAAAAHSVPFGDSSSSANWFGTSMDSNASSFGQSPVFGGRDLLVTPSNSTGHLIDGGFTGGEEDESSQRSHQEMFEKRRRRRESHNAVERRRRDNINERIQELSTMLPDHLLESVPASSNVMSVATGQTGANGKPINKGTILKLSVDHIKELRDEVTNCKGRIKELERMIEIAKRGGGGVVVDNHNHSYQLKQEDGGLDLYTQQQQQQAYMMNNNGSTATTTTRPPRQHERVGSIQFQQQFGKLHIDGDEQQ